MKYSLLLIILVASLFSCKKDETFTKQNTYLDIVYRIQSGDSNLMISFMRGVYTETVKGNIATDSVLIVPNVYNIPATVLTGAKVELFAESRMGPNFHLEIVDDNGKKLAETDTVTFYPATPLRNYDQWVSKLTIIP